jgi:hypothetical protein
MRDRIQVSRIGGGARGGGRYERLTIGRRPGLSEFQATVRHYADVVESLPFPTRQAGRGVPKEEGERHG